MAEQRRKTQAERAAQSKKQNRNTTAKKSVAEKKAAPENRIPLRIIASVVSIVLFLVFLLALLFPDGAVYFFNPFLR